jgi:pimeloyl-ACP methyl ester carboxylesterase
MIVKCAENSMPKLNINGVNSYYEVCGQGEPLILLHHGFGSAKIWEDLLPGFAARYKVVSYDRRGFGESDEEENFQNYYWSEQYTENSVKELSILLEYLNIKDEIRLLGQCEGGVIGFCYAAQHPRRVKAIAISTTLCYSKVAMPELYSSRMFSSFEEADLEFQHKLVYWHGETRACRLYALALPGGGAYGSEDALQPEEYQRIILSFFDRHR